MQSRFNAYTILYFLFFLGIIFLFALAISLYLLLLLIPYLYFATRTFKRIKINKQTQTIYFSHIFTSLQKTYKFDEIKGFQLQTISRKHFDFREIIFYAKDRFLFKFNELNSKDYELIEDFAIRNYSLLSDRLIPLNEKSNAKKLAYWNEVKIEIAENRVINYIILLFGIGFLIYVLLGDEKPQVYNPFLIIFIILFFFYTSRLIYYIKKYKNLKKIRGR